MIPSVVLTRKPKHAPQRHSLDLETTEIEEMREKRDINIFIDKV